MSILTVAVLKKAVPGIDAEAWVQPLNTAMAEFGINTPVRQAMFLAQAGHESASFKALAENMNYRAARLLVVFPKYFRDIHQAALYAGHPEKIANRVYAGRFGNRHELSGDGWRYRARGPIGITFRDNYAACGKALRLPLTDSPELLSSDKMAGARSAAWFFVERGNCIAAADRGDVATVTRKINGGLNGLDDRRDRYIRAIQVLGG